MPSLSDRIKSLLHRRSTQDQQPQRPGPASSAPNAKPTDAPSKDPTDTALPPPATLVRAPTLRTHDHSSVKATATASTVTGQLSVNIKNNFASNEPAYAYITGIALDRNNAIFLLQSDGKTPYYPANVSSTGTKIPVNVSIPLGAPGNTVHATIPRLAGARIWFSVGKQLEFFLNPGPGLVEPSVFNAQDANYGTNFGFAEFTFSSSVLFVNVSYVDFLPDLPIAISLTDTSGATQSVQGTPANGLASVAAGLRALGGPWSSLVVQNNGRDLRALSPNSGNITHSGLFQGYYDNYVNQVWSKFTSSPLTVDTQASYGKVNGQVRGDVLDFGNGTTFSKPSTADIFSCSSGPFATGSNGLTNVIIPRLAAAFNRTTLLLSNETPNGINASQYYAAAPTNEYSKLLHATTKDHLGYGFPYDDVVRDGGAPQEGAIVSYTPTGLSLTVGG